MALLDIGNWTYGFMQRNETQCVEYIVSLQDQATVAVQNGNFKQASNLFRDIAYGMEKLSAIDREYYEPLLYAALLYVTKIEAFGMENRREAIKQLKRACLVAEDCIGFDRSCSEMAETDLRMMHQFLTELKTGTSLPKLREEYGEELLHPSNSSENNEDNTISGIGCLVAVVAIIFFCVMYSFILTKQ